MYQKILVPLDGSELAECSLEHVSEVAKGCHVSEVVLLSVVEPVKESVSPSWGTLAGTQTQLEAGRGDKTTAAIDFEDMRGQQQAAEYENRQKALAGDYLFKVADRLAQDGINVMPVVTIGKAAESILDYAGSNHIDLIIMATHGRGGDTRWDFGKVADRIIRNSNIPVLMASPKGCRV